MDIGEVVGVTPIKPQLRSSNSSAEPATLASAASSTSASGGGAAGANAGEDAAEAGAVLVSEEGAELDAAVLLPDEGWYKPHRFNTAILSRSSAERMPAFLINRCFFRRSLRPTLRASDTSFIAFCIAAFARAMESSKSMRGRFSRFLPAGEAAALASGVEAAGIVAAALGCSAGLSVAPSMPWSQLRSGAGTQ